MARRWARGLFFDVRLLRGHAYWLACALLSAAPAHAQIAQPGVAPAQGPDAGNAKKPQTTDDSAASSGGQASPPDLDKPIVTTCGSGITASVLAFGLHLLGKDAAVYDGSWSEWGADRSTPKATGAA